MHLKIASDGKFSLLRYSEGFVTCHAVQCFGLIEHGMQLDLNFSRFLFSIMDVYIQLDIVSYE